MIKTTAHNSCTSGEGNKEIPQVNILLSQLKESAQRIEGKPPAQPEVEEPRIVTFPWIKSFQSRCRQDLLSSPNTNTEILENLMTIFISHVKAASSECHLKPNRASKLKNVMNEFMFMFHLIYGDIKKPLEHCGYLDKMSDLCALFVGMEIMASGRRKESNIRIASKVTTALFLFLDRSQDHILSALLKARYMTKSNGDLCSKIFSRVLRDHPGRALFEMTYVRYVLVYKKWKHVVKGIEERRRVMNQAASKLVPPYEFRERLKTDLKDVFPKIPKNRDDITMFLMQAKFCIREKTEAFLRIVADPRQQVVVPDGLSSGRFSCPDLRDSNESRADDLNGWKNILFFSKDKKQRSKIKTANKKVPKEPIKKTIAVVRPHGSKKIDSAEEVSSDSSSSLIKERPVCSGELVQSDQPLSEISREHVPVSSVKAMVTERDVPEAPAEPLNKPISTKVTPSIRAAKKMILLTSAKKAKMTLPKKDTFGDQFDPKNSAEEQPHSTTPHVDDLKPQVLTKPKLELELPSPSGNEVGDVHMVDCKQEGAKESDAEHEKSLSPDLVKEEVKITRVKAVRPMVGGSSSLKQVNPVSPMNAVDAGGAQVEPQRPPILGPSCARGGPACNPLIASCAPQQSHPSRPSSSSTPQSASVTSSAPVPPAVYATPAQPPASTHTQVASVAPFGSAPSVSKTQTAPSTTVSSQPRVAPDSSVIPSTPAVYTSAIPSAAPLSQLSPQQPLPAPIPPTIEPADPESSTTAVSDSVAESRMDVSGMSTDEPVESQAKCSDAPLLDSEAVDFSEGHSNQELIKITMGNLRGQGRSTKSPKQMPAYSPSAPEPSRTPPQPADQTLVKETGSCKEVVLASVKIRKTAYIAGVHRFHPAMQGKNISMQKSGKVPLNNQLRLLIKQDGPKEMTKTRRSKTGGKRRGPPKKCTAKKGGRPSRSKQGVLSELINPEAWVDDMKLLGERMKRIIGHSSISNV